MFNQTKNHRLPMSVRHFMYSALAFGLTFMSLALTAYAVSPGTLDPNFGTSGIALRNISNTNDEILALAIQPDNKIVAVGYSESTAVFTVTRFNANGTPDTSFGTGGLVQTSFAQPNNLAAADVPSYAYSVAIQADGKIVVGGDIGPNQAFGLARYTSAGQLDTSFDTDGKVITNLQNLAAIRQIAIQSDGKIIAVGSTTAGDFAVARYASNGALDATFGGGDGIVITDFYNESDSAASVKLQADGKIVVAGLATGEDLAENFAVARYNTNGSLDTTFNGTGLKTVFTECGPEALGCGAETMGIQPDGKIVVASGDDDVYMARFNPDGSQINGIITTNIGGLTDKAYSMAIDLNGGILLAGSTVSKGDENFFVAKYQSNGTLDPTFDSGDGIVITSLGSNSDSGYAIAIQPNGGIIVGGSKGDFGSKEFALVRYLGLQPTAANALLSGRITTAGGNGISNVRVALTNGQGNTVYAITSSFGYYNFYDVPVGETYILTPNSTKYTFSPTTLVVTLMEDLTTANFTAQ